MITATGASAPDLLEVKEDLALRARLDGAATTRVAMYRRIRTLITKRSREDQELFNLILKLTGA